MRRACAPRTRSPCAAAPPSVGFGFGYFRVFFGRANDFLLGVRVSEPLVQQPHPRLGVQSSGFRVQGSGFRVQGSGFRVQGAGFRVQGSGFMVQGSGPRVQGVGVRVQGSGVRVQSWFRLQGLWSLVSDVGSRFSNLPHLALISGCYLRVFFVGRRIWFFQGLMFWTWWSELCEQTGMIRFSGFGFRFANQKSQT